MNITSKILIAALLVIATLGIVPAGAQPPIHTFATIQPDQLPSIESFTIHNAIVAPAPPAILRRQRIKRRLIRASKLFLRFAINGLEVAGSLAQLLQFMRHP